MFRTRLWLVVLVLILVAFGVGSSMVLIRDGEIGLRYRLGKLQRDHSLGPGLHFGLPSPLDRVAITSVGEQRMLQHKFRFGARATDASDALIVRGGKRIVEGDVSVTFRVRDPRLFLGRYMSVRTVLRALMRRTVTRRLLERDGERDIAASLQKRLAEQCADLRLGIQVEAVHAAFWDVPMRFAADEITPGGNEQATDKPASVKNKDRLARAVESRRIGHAMGLMYRVEAMHKAQGVERGLLERIAHLNAVTRALKGRKVHVSRRPSPDARATTRLKRLSAAEVDRLLRGEVPETKR